MIKAINILWDFDDGEKVNLPNEIDIPSGITGEEEISDYISDVTGFCHKGFEIINKYGGKYHYLYEKENAAAKETLSVADGCKLICRAAELEILTMPTANSVMLQICYEDGHIRWEERNILEAAADLVASPDNVSILKKAICEAETERNSLGNLKFTDEILWVVSKDKEGGVSAKEIILTAEYDEPITLDSLRNGREAIIMVLAEGPLDGSVYCWGNHGGYWEKVGILEGFA